MIFKTLQKMCGILMLFQVSAFSANPIIDSVSMNDSAEIWQTSHQDLIRNTKSLLPIQISGIRWTFLPSPGKQKWYLQTEKGIPFSLEKNDRIDLDILIPKNTKANEMTRIYGEFTSDREGILRMGISADWWWEAFANGELVYDAMEKGNNDAVYDPAKHAFYIPVRKGRNLLAIRHVRGTKSRLLAVQVLPAEKIKPVQAETVTDLHVSMKQEKGTTRVFSDIQSAYDKIIQMHKSAKKATKYRILVHGGRYEIKTPLHFSAEIPIEIRPFNQEKVLISGGTVLKKWERTKINGRICFRTKLPAGVKELPFLYVNGKTAEPARWPKKDFLVPEEYPAGEKPYDSFYIKKGDFQKSWYDPGNIWVRLTHFWIEENLRLESVQNQDNQLKTACRIRFKASKKSQYFFFNVREALTEKNEYYFDRKTRELFYIPEKVNEPFEAVIPVCGVLLQADSGVKGLVLRGLVFAHGGNYIPEEVDGLDLRQTNLPDIRYPLKKTKGSVQKTSYTSNQAAIHLPGALMFDKASDCAVIDCEIRECAWNGIRVQTSSRNLRFEGNIIHEMGGGGIHISGMPYKMIQAKPSLEVSRIIINRNHIYNCGNFFCSAIGIMIRNACGCLIQQNHIHDLYYSGISSGWVWGYADNAAHDIRVRRNYIHDIGKGLLSDMAGIYFLGKQPGSRIYENVIHDVTCSNYGGHGIYPDEGSSHIVIERNIAFRCASSGFYLHFGSENIIRNNVFAFNGQGGATLGNDSRIGAEDYPGEFHGYMMSLVNNVFYKNKNGAIYLYGQKLFTAHKFYSESNVFYDPAGAKDFEAARIFKNSYTFPEWQSYGYDRLSIFADPGFENPEKGNFRLKKDSVLWKYGFGFLNDLLKDDFSLKD